ncbi:MAG: phosphate ABC transporter substrate-binding protein PstS [Cyanobacteria bacterium]|nr:phosphate ABC transporter substrate-binding protein PstS [Cyanobacteria bacterium CG_2015-16_32_12]NCO77515.1 phosphate ABC transporter substrate-binding protein PstS [Cyanobacteria bacterium CG_2015-22_32_23]NCQ04195.1 phosphate ABC transporter substrate-binding protein PstS [Cyanobacteria bacterium CG_2015-09_32_10]NCQ41744.1 phosphate ABC transporter substrate-binding protein PstS [Cyanobacteria bacterium CG_2015-04_32_10]NCS84207.1 phosphate ABC transporter substrate-binding protein PstS
MTDFNIRRRDFLYGLAGLSGSVIASQLPFESASAQAMRINGAGASFPAPLFQRWFVEYNKINKNTQVNYQSVGSGAGIKQFIGNTVDFGASDVAMKDDEIAKVSRGVVLLPVTAGSVVLAFNNKDVTTVKLTRQQLADIFLGKITNWNQIGSPKSKPIRVIYRSDGSGTTGVFTKHLAAINSEWKSKVGEGTTVQWPAGIGAKGNEGITATILQTDGAIGYIEYGFAKKNGLKTAQLQNKAGKFIAPTPQNAAVSLSQIQLPANLRAFAPDPSGDRSYPIVSFSWILAYKKYPDAKKAQSLKQVLTWAVSKTGGQKFSADLGYIPLPDNVIQKVTAAINTIS